MADEYIRIVSHKDDVKRDTEEAIEKGLQGVGIEAQRNISIKAPVDTGRMAASITYATRHRQGEADRSYYDQEKAARKNNLLKPEDYRKLGEPDEHMVVLGTNVEYAEAREFSSDENSHFIRRGMQNHTNSYKKIMESALKEIE